MKALVTGGSGYFDSLLLRTLQKRDWQVGILDIADADDSPD